MNYPDHPILPGKAQGKSDGCPRSSPDGRPGPLRPLHTIFELSSTARYAQVIVVYVSAIFLCLVSCTPETPLQDSDTGDTYPLEAHQLELLWCPNETEVQWDFQFGLDPPEWGEANPPEWLGSSSMQLGNPDFSVGVGRGAHMCGCSHGTCPCALKEAQEFARAWRISGIIKTEIPAEQLEQFDVTIWERPAQETEWFQANELVLKARFEVFPPAESNSIGCVSLHTERTPD